MTDVAERDALRLRCDTQAALIAELRAEAREAAQVLIAEVGADGPMSVLDAAHRAVARINKLIARNAGLFTELSVTMEEHARIKGLIERGEVGR